jgi:hypothetical protein
LYYGIAGRPDAVAPNDSKTIYYCSIDNCGGTVFTSKIPCSTKPCSNPLGPVPEVVTTTSFPKATFNIPGVYKTYAEAQKVCATTGKVPGPIESGYICIAPGTVA